MEINEWCFPYLEKLVFFSKGVELVVEAVEHVHHIHRLIIIIDRHHTSDENQQCYRKYSPFFGASSLSRTPLAHEVNALEEGHDSP